MKKMKNFYYFVCFLLPKIKLIKIISSTDKIREINLMFIFEISDGFQYNNRKRTDFKKESNCPYGFCYYSLFLSEINFIFLFI